MTLNVILWKSDSPVSRKLEFLKNLGLFVSIKSTHVDLLGFL